MYNIKNFEPYALRKHLGNAIVLVWSKSGGYQFMNVLDRAMADDSAFSTNYKIIAVEKD